MLEKWLAGKLDSIGALAFLGVAAAGLWLTGTFFDNFIATPPARHFTLPSSGTILLSNIALGLKVASSLLLVFLVLAAFRIAHARPSRDEEEG